MAYEPFQKPSGLQVAFLIFAVVLLAVPFQRYVAPLMGLGATGTMWDRLYVFAPAVAILLLVPGLRRYCIARLSEPVLAARRMEVGIVAAAKSLFPFAVAGAIVLWYWAWGGEMALARRVGEQRSPESELALALTVQSATGYLFMAGLLGPIVEELLFRGLLYDAWKERWGWFLSMLATSLVFALYHPMPLAAFFSSIVFVLVMRRAGSIRAAILVHIAGNVALWYPLMGQLYFNTRGKETGEIHLWSFHLAVLALFAIALPVYLWMARDASTEADGIEEDTVVAR